MYLLNIGRVCNVGIITVVHSYHTSFLLWEGGNQTPYTCRKEYLPQQIVSFNRGKMYASLLGDALPAGHGRKCCGYRFVGVCVNSVRWEPQAENSVTRELHIPNVVFHGPVFS